MTFEAELDRYMGNQRKGKTGEHLARLEKGLNHAERLFLEQVWWPAVQSFDYLHAEYEVADFKDGVRYLDFAYIRPPYRICFEIDGYRAHQRDISRWQFTDQLERQNHLVLDNWLVFRFYYDSINEKPRNCQQFVQQIMGKWFSNHQNQTKVTLKEREIIRYVQFTSHHLRQADVQALLEIGEKQARGLLRGLVDKGILEPHCKGTKRIHFYALASSWKNRLL